MKKIGVFLLMLLLIPSVLAIETTLNENYQPKETLIATIQGNFIDNIKAEDILFYSGRAFIPMVYDLAKIQDKYHLYALLPNKERNYTLIIKNAHYTEAGEEKLEDLKFDFKVSGNLSPFTVNPGFVITNKDFDVKVESNLKTLNLITDFLNSSREAEISAGREKKILFSVSGINKFTLTYLTLEAEGTRYEIPVAIFPTEISEEIEIAERMRFFKSELKFTVLKNQEFQLPVTIINVGEEDIENIEFEFRNLGEIITTKPEKLEKLETNKMKEIILIINSDKEGLTEGSLLAGSGNYSAELFLSITTTQDEKEFQEFVEEAEIIEEESCSDLGGGFCDEDEECEGTSKLTIDSIGSLCCVGECKKEEKGAGKTIALTIILIVLAVIGFFVFKKLKEKKKTSREILKEKSKAYEERFKPERREIKGGLSRV